MKQLIQIILILSVPLIINAQGPDYRSLVSEADLDYDEPVIRSEDGMPLGNGVMGTLVWTTPGAVRMQINRNDVFGVNKSTDSFKERHSDYASGCAYVDINVLDYGDDVFYGDQFNQRIHLYDGVMAVDGKGLKSRFIALENSDVIAIEIEDLRDNPSSISIDLRMLRYLMQYSNGENYELSRNNIVKVKRRGHTAQSQLHIKDKRIALTQEFSEKDFYNSSAVAVSVKGRPSQSRVVNESTVRLSVAPDKGKFTIFISSDGGAKDMSESLDDALASLEEAESNGFEQCFSHNKDWWHEFWSRSYVDLSSDDGEADFVEKHHTYFQYIMACSSRGLYQPRYGGMLWYTNGDMREWGSQYWWNNQSCYYYSLPSSNRLDLMDPLFSMFSRHLDSYATAAHQQWGSKGLWFPETTFFDGLNEMPDDIAAEMRDLYLMRKPWEERSERFRKYAATKPKHNPRWNWATVGHWEDGHWVIPEKGVGPFGHVSHMVSTTAEVAYLYWLRYEYSIDKDWLKEYAYPVLKGAIEFYRNFPEMIKEDDGRYHLYHTNNFEGMWNVHNSFKDISAIHGLTPILIRAAKILGEDEDMVPVWTEFLENISPVPASGLVRPDDMGKSEYWIGCVPPAGRGNADSPQRMIHYDYCTVGTADKEIWRKGNATFDKMYSKGVNASTSVHVVSRNPVFAALLGRGEALKYMLPNQLRSELTPDKDFCDFKGSGEIPLMRNRMTLREGPGAIGAQRLGNVATAVNYGLIQSVPSMPGGDPVIYLFPAWPEEWDASFELLARGGFLVSAGIKDASIGEVAIKSLKGGTCRIKNPWGAKDIVRIINGKKKTVKKQDILEIGTSRGDTIILKEIK